LQGALEQRPGFLELTLRAIQVPEVVRPPEVAGVERLRVQEGRFGAVIGLRRHQQLAHVAVGATQIDGGRPFVIDHALQRFVPVANLRLRRCGHLREIRQRHRPQRPSVRCDRGGSRRCLRPLLTPAPATHEQRARSTKGQKCARETWPGDVLPAARGIFDFRCGDLRFIANLQINRQSPDRRSAI
jgi:hypothetical protein